MKKKRKKLRQAMNQKFPTLDLQFVKDSLAELDLSLDGKQSDDAYQTALVVVSALACGPDPQCLAKFTQLPVEFVQAIRRCMIAAELWTVVDSQLRSLVRWS